MDLPILSFLDGASPWLWAVLAIVLAAAELAVTGFVLMWFALAAAAVAVALLVVPGLSGAWQLAIFAAVSVATVLAARGPVMRALTGATPRPGLNNRAARLVGRTALVTQDFAAGQGAVEIDGVRWKARLAPDDAAAAAPAAAPAAGAEVVVRGHEGAALLVSAA
ncbi:NfeD family protein [Rhodovulum sp. DZ06]|uniref:NfeD family protein n=1 Tax=Rhodovulum sp. DZ06 TaxID=3425126 RepID=UPI003D338301